MLELRQGVFSFLHGFIARNFKIQAKRLKFRAFFIEYFSHIFVVDAKKIQNNKRIPGAPETDKSPPAAYTVGTPETSNLLDVVEGQKSNLLMFFLYFASTFVPPY